jgi:hypothetical protein
MVASFLPQRPCFPAAKYVYKRAVLADVGFDDREGTWR